MAKLTDFKTPTGTKGNILNPGDWISLILGGVVLIFTFAASQNVAKLVGGKVPYADSTIDPLWEQKQPQGNQNQGTRWI